MPLQKYIEKYVEENDPKWIEAYLYYNENRINEEVKGFVQDYAMQGHFMDLKSAYVFGIMNALKHYNLAKGSFSRNYQRRYVKRAVDDYIRTSRTGYTIPNDSEYLVLRKIMAIFAKNDYKYSDDLIGRIAAEVKRSPKTVKEMLDSGLRNMRFTDFYFTYPDEDGEVGAEDVTVDHSTEPYTMYRRCLQSDILREAYDKLEYRERDIVSSHLGFCIKCWSIRFAVDHDGQKNYRYFKPETFIDIAARHGISSNSVKRIYTKALEKMRKALEIAKCQNGLEPSPDDDLKSSIIGEKETD